MLFYIIYWIANPDNVPIKMRIISIVIFSFKFLFLLNNTKSPTPAPEHNPATSDPNEIIPFKKPCVKITDAAQFGISPIKDAIKGWIKLSFKKREVNFSSPVISIARLKIKDAINTNKNILTVCISADFIMPSSQLSQFPWKWWCSLLLSQIISFLFLYIKSIINPKRIAIII